MTTFLCGFALCAALLALWEWLSARSRRPTPSSLTGSYRDARRPFAIVAGRSAEAPERSEELIAREARRLMLRGVLRPTNMKE